MFRPARVTFPESTRKVPATELSNVYFPEPFVPMMMRNEPRSRVRETLRKARTSLAVPGKKVLVSRVSSSISRRRNFGGRGRFELAQESGGNQGNEDKGRGDELKVIRIQSPAQRDRDQQAEQNGTHDRPGDQQADFVTPDTRFPDDHAGPAPHHHPDAHLHVRETLILSQH